MVELNKSYYAIVPANVRYDNELTANAKLLYGEITALCNEKGFCWASNEYFAKLYSVSKKSISIWINQLNLKGYVKTTLIYKEGSKEIVNRYIQICVYPIEKNFYTPMEEKVKENITFFNNFLFEPKKQVQNEEIFKGKTKKNKKIFESDSKQYKCAEYLAKMISENIVGAPPKDEHTLQSWAYTFDLMFRLDKIDPYDLKNVLEFSQTDSFWSRNILSADKFRKQYLQLLAKMQGVYKK